MNAAELVERQRAELDEIERVMMDAPDLIEVLRQPRAEAQAALLRAEWRLAAEERAQPRELTWEERQALWEEWTTIRHQRRSTMSPRLKSYVLRTFGKELYRSLRW